MRERAGERASKFVRQSLRNAVNKMLFVMLRTMLVGVVPLHFVRFLHHHVAAAAAAVAMVVSVSWSKASRRGRLRERLRPSSVWVENTKSFSLAHNRIRLRTRKEQ